MTIPTEAPVVDDTAASRFVIREDGTEAELVYLVEGDRLLLLHTEVPEEWGGRGIGRPPGPRRPGAGRADGLTVVPWCPFARRWLRRPPRRGGCGHHRLGDATSPVLSPPSRPRPEAGAALRGQFPRCSPSRGIWHFRWRGRNEVSATPQDEPDEVEADPDDYLDGQEEDSFPCL